MGQANRVPKVEFEMLDSSPLVADFTQSRCIGAPNAELGEEFTRKPCQIEVEDLSECNGEENSLMTGVLKSSSNNSCEPCTINDYNPAYYQEEMHASPCVKIEN